MRTRQAASRSLAARTAGIVRYVKVSKPPPHHYPVEADPAPDFRQRLVFGKEPFPPFARQSVKISPAGSASCFRDRLIFRKQHPGLLGIHRPRGAVIARRRLNHLVLGALAGVWPLRPRPFASAGLAWLRLPSRPRLLKLSHNVLLLSPLTLPIRPRTWQAARFRPGQQRHSGAPGNARRFSYPSSSRALPAGRW
jgi:hypothetical protein